MNGEFHEPPDELPEVGSLVEGIQIAKPCLSISPLLSTHGTFGTGFACKHPEGHDGDHAQTITWTGHDYTEEIGRMELTWSAR